MKTYKLIAKIVDTAEWIDNKFFKVAITEDQVKDLIEQYNKPTHKRKYFVPKVDERYYYISGFSLIEYTRSSPDTLNIWEKIMKRQKKWHKVD